MSRKLNFSGEGFFEAYAAKMQAERQRGRSVAMGTAGSGWNAYKTQPRTQRNISPGSGRSCRRWRSWAGPSAATCGSHPLGHGQCRRGSQARRGIGGFLATLPLR
jgi:hypothetical protein